MRSKIILGCCIGLISAWALQGQKYRYAYYQGEELPFTAVNEMVEGPQGYVWLGTDQGLYRFDGSRFEDFNTFLRSRTIRSFSRIGDSTLLFTNDTGIHQISFSKGQPQISNFDVQARLHYPTNLFTDSRGRLWSAQMDGTVVSFEKGAREGAVFPLQQGVKTPRMAFAEDARQTLWVLVPGSGLFYFEDITHRFKEVPGTDGFQDLAIGQGRLWLAGEVLQSFNITAEKQLVNRKVFGASGPFDRLGVDSKGTVYASSGSALFSLQGGAGLTRVFGANDPHRVEELSYGAIRHLQFSKSESQDSELIWVASDRGLTLMWSGYFQSVSGLGHDNIRAINSNPKGPLIISQGDAVRILLDQQGRDIGFERIPGLNGVVGITSAQDRVWYGTAEGQIHSYSGDRRLQTLDLSQRGSGVFFLISDHRNNIWFCQAASDKPVVGTARLNPQGRLFEYGKDKGFENRVLVVREGGKNELYAAGIGLSTYLYKYDAVNDRFENKSLPLPFKASSTFEVHDMVVDRLGLVWLATTDGLLKYDTEGIHKIDLGPYSDQEIRSITAQPGGELWLATATDGLLYLDAAGNYVNFDEASGTPSRIASYRCMVLNQNGRLWVGTPEGVVYSSQPNPVPHHTSSPIIRRILVDGLDTTPSDRLRFGEGQQARLELTTLTFPGDGLLYQYKYFEEGLPTEDIEDLPWVALSETALELQEVTGGMYRLYVRVQDSGGYRWSLPLEISFEVTRKWYRTLWGMGFLLGAAFFFFWFFVRRWLFRRLGQLQSTLNRQQKQLAEKEALLKSTGVNTYLLNRLIGQLPTGASWETTLKVMARLVELPTGIDRFALAAKFGEVLVCRGYARGNDTEQRWEEPFNEKENLLSFVMVAEKPLLIGDFEKEVGNYVRPQQAKGYASRILMPFEHKGTPLVFCLYSREPKAFSKQTHALLGILVKFLTINTVDGFR
ncbi:ligand-binding sensor domain-containing protein [Robiginitalea sp. IMCC43444]|uniref:ligand-binding sensor domain-containing protein n=1 Tax=Robiginitalea sp. IMCC43444 TaxID=3459121 RepID=UPI0040422B16